VGWDMEADGLPKARWECNGSECKYWEVLHGVGSNEYRNGEFAKCVNCTRPARLEAYKKHWANRKESNDGMD